MRRSRLAQVLILVLVIAAGGAIPALANNTHVVNNVGHGLGDGSDNDYYVHPYTDTGSTYTKKGYTLWSTPCYYVCETASGYFTHVHTSWDTNPYAECRYKSDHWSINVYTLNAHTHYHHYPC